MYERALEKFVHAQMVKDRCLIPFFPTLHFPIASLSEGGVMRVTRYPEEIFSSRFLK